MQGWYLETKNHIADSKSLLEYGRAIDKVREHVKLNPHLTISQLVASIDFYPQNSRGCQRKGKTSKNWMYKW